MKSRFLRACIAVFYLPMTISSLPTLAIEHLSKRRAGWRDLLDVCRQDWKTLEDLSAQLQKRGLRNADVKELKALAVYLQLHKAAECEGEQIRITKKGMRARHNISLEDRTSWKGPPRIG